MTYPVVVDASYAARLLPEARAKAEREAIERILQLVPDTDRVQLQELLSTRKAMPRAARDPEVARLLGILVSMMSLSNQMTLPPSYAVRETKVSRFFSSLKQLRHRKPWEKG